MGENRIRRTAAAFSAVVLIGAGGLACSDDDADEVPNVDDGIEEGVDDLEEGIEEGTDKLEDEADDLTDDDTTGDTTGE